MIPAALAAAFTELGPVLNQLNNASQVAGMVQGLGGRLSAHGSGSPFNLGSTGSGATGMLQRMFMPVASMGQEATRLGLNLGIERPMRFGGDVASLGMRFGSQQQQAVAGDMIGRGTNILSKGLDTLTNPIDPSNWAELGAEIVDLLPQLEKWGDLLAASAEKLKQFDSNMAAADVLSRVGDIQRSMQSAAATGGSTLAMVEALEEFKNELQPAKDFITNVLNELLRGGLSLGTDVIRAIGDIRSWVVYALNVIIEIAKKFTWGSWDDKLSAMQASLSRIATNTTPKPTGDRQTQSIIAIARERRAALAPLSSPVAGGGY